MTWSRRCTPNAIGLVAILAAGLGAPYGAVAANPTCIRTYDIDHTEIPDDSTILFYMRDRSVYRNRLPQRCAGLRLANSSFTYEPTNPASEELCDNLGIFRVNDGTGPALSTINVCAFGSFERLATPAR